jgi:hypothetical protein
MDKSLLIGTMHRGLVDMNGKLIPIPARVLITKLPLIDRADFSELPTDMEMRLLIPASDEEPSVIIFHPGSELRLEISLRQIYNLRPHVAKVREAVEQFAMGVPPGG